MRYSGMLGNYSNGHVMKVMKFGGSSVGTPERIQDVIAIVNAGRQKSEQCAVVFSAYQGVTDQLIKMSTMASQGDTSYKKIAADVRARHLAAATALLSTKRAPAVSAVISERCDKLDGILQGLFLVKEVSPKTLDYVMSFGERLSAYTISECFKDRKIDCEYLDTCRVIKTNGAFGSAKVNFAATKKCLREHFASCAPLQIATGFIASTQKNETTTLGRGGSDYTASIIGAALHADIIEIWTDVDGVLTANPSKVKSAFPIPHLTYEEAMEMSHFGAKVIHPPTMQPALVTGIPIVIKNTFNPAFPGTLIDRRRTKQTHLIKGISSIDHIALLLVKGIGMVGIVGTAERIFGALSHRDINVMMITQASSEHSICLAVPPHSMTAAKEAIEEEFRREIKDKLVDEVVVGDSYAIIAIVGEQMRYTRGIAGRLFHSLGANGINVTAIAQGSSELNISVVIDRKDESAAMTVLHDSFFQPDRKVVNLYLVGTGLVGGAFLQRLKKVSAMIEQNERAVVQVVGVANAISMLIEPKGVNLDRWQKQMLLSGTPTDLNAFLTIMKETHRANSIFVDCTASQNLADSYADILAAGIHIVTPNKRANARESAYYRKMRTLGAAKHVAFRYETNVGAALPLIGPIKDLVATGDTITKIEAILSGTLSFIFNSFTEGKKFSEVVVEAQARGYTEPDPREDLNGNDVARKLLILARESGYSLELKRIRVENLIPVDARKAKTVEQFFSALKRHDAAFARRRDTAAARGCVLRYVARYENGTATVSLDEVPLDHPFASVKGSDNIVAISSELYCQTPLIVQGAGAGADITAAGVLADVLSIVRSHCQ
ncbi:MAG: bifunctional aspartate kinase/homoserine dehydrogenase I [Ignavibacteriales bacterium]|nr:bifunctional aspartate kinase/homoserine dehydrogenase I [Ignavibacteriales bacterium]